MSKYTPGPWQYVFEGGTTAFIVEADGSTIICIRVTENTTAHKNLATNIRLIAAAPDLLKALNLMRERFLDTEGDHGRWEREATEAADAAIAKATGQNT